MKSIPDAPSFSIKAQLINHIRSKYRAEPEYLWMRWPEYAVFRHADNKKWFGIIMNVSRSKLGIDGDGNLDIMNVKLNDPLLADLLIKEDGYLRAYHMGHGDWVSVLLDGTVPFEDVCRLLDKSYLATASQEKKRKLRPNKEWIIPANPKYYDIESAFHEADEIEWKQGSGIIKGDTVFVYVAAPVSAIIYKCVVTETDIPFRYDDGRVHMNALMKIRLKKRYAPDEFTFETLGKEYGIFAVRGPRGIPTSLSEALNRR